MHAHLHENLQNLEVRLHPKFPPGLHDQSRDPSPPSACLLVCLLFVAQTIGSGYRVPFYHAHYPRPCVLFCISKNLALIVLLSFPFQSFFQARCCCRRRGRLPVWDRCCRSNDSVISYYTYATLVRHRSACIAEYSRRYYK